MATWEERLDTAATEAEAATDKAETAAQIFYDVANGTDTETVTTINGEVKTLAKFNADNQVLFDNFLTNNQDTFDTFFSDSQSTFNTFISDSQTEFNNELTTFQNEFDNVINIALTDAEEAITEEHILTSNTDTITLTGFTNDGVALYVEGSREFNFTKSGSNDIVFDDVLPSGTTVWAVKRNLEGSFDISIVSLSDAGNNLTQTLAEWINDFYTLDAADILPTYTGNSGDIALKVNTAEDGVEWAPIFPSFTGNAGNSLNVNSAEDGVEWAPILPDLTGNAEKSLKVNFSGDGVEWGLPVQTEFEEFTASGTWNKDPNAQWVYVEAIGGGAGGDSSGAQAVNGGGGGAYAAKVFRASDVGASETLVVGLGGDPGSAGGTSSFGPHLSAGGGGEYRAVLSYGGGGEFYGGYAAGAGGRGSDNSGDGFPSVMGGAGGAGGGETGSGGSGGISQNAGDGGDGFTAAGTTGGDGQFPGGGGGAGEELGGSGGDGVVRIWQW